MVAEVTQKFSPSRRKVSTNHCQRQENELFLTNQIDDLQKILVKKTISWLFGLFLTLIATYGLRITNYVISQDYEITELRVTG